MNTRFHNIIFLSAATAGMLAAGFAVPASAASSNDSDAYLTVTAGSLNISISPTSTNLGSVSDTVNGSTVTHSLGEVTVTDARGQGTGGVANWVAQVSSSNFVPSGGGTAISASGVGYAAGTAAATGPGAATEGFTISNQADIATSENVVASTGVTQNNAATWTPDLSVKIPSGAGADLYTATVTHSVA